MTQYEKMTETNVNKLVLSLAIPTIISMLLTAIYNIADTFFVSQLGNSPSAAVSIVFSLMTLIQSFGFTIGMGCGSMISRKLGHKDKLSANKYATNGIFVGLIIGIIFLTFGLIFNKQIMGLLGATSTSIDYAVQYALWIFIASPFMMLSFILNNILRSEGKSKFSMFGICFGGLLNIGLDPLFIYGFNLGISGAGLATMISQIFSFCILASFFLINKTETKINFKYLTKEKEYYKNIFKCGSPTLFRQGFSTSANIILNLLAKPYGDATIAAFGITTKIYMFVRNIIIGIGQGYQPVLGVNFGAKKYQRIKKAFNFTLILQTSVCLVAALVTLIIPETLVSFFRNDPEVIEVGRYSVRFLAFSLPLLGFSTLTNLSLQVIGKAKSASFLASCRQGIVFTPIIFLFNFLFKRMGLCLTQSISDVITAIITIPFYIYLFRYINNLEESQNDKKLSV